MLTPYTKLMLKDPAAPVLQVDIISTIDNAKKDIIGAILDSGSSITLIPESVRIRVEPRLTGKEVIVDILGREAERPLYEVKPIFANYPNLKLPPIQVAVGG